MTIKKLPLTLIPILLFLVFLLLFLFVPAGGDLISTKGDYLVGQILGNVTFFCLLVDVVRFIKSKRMKN